MTRTTRDGVVKGRGRGKSTPKPRIPSCRVKRLSLKRKENDETEEYLSAAESLTDIIITNGSISDVMQSYEDSLLEDSAFEDSALEIVVDQDYAVVASDDGVEIVDKVGEVVSGDGVEIAGGEGPMDKEIIVSNNDVVGNDDVIGDENMKVVAGESHPVDNADEMVASDEKISKLVSLPDSVKYVDEKYVTDISFVETLDHNKGTWTYLENLLELHDHSITLDIINLKLGDPYVVKREASICSNCQNLEHLVNEYELEIGNWKLCHSMIDDLHIEISEEREKAKQENNSLSADIANLRQELKKRDGRIEELTKDDVSRNELLKLVDERAESDAQIDALLKKLQEKTDEVELLKENVDYYMNSYTKIKNELKVFKVNERPIPKQRPQVLLEETPQVLSATSGGVDQHINMSLPKNPTTQIASSNEPPIQSVAPSNVCILDDMQTSALSSDVSNDIRCWLLPRNENGKRISLPPHLPASLDTVLTHPNPLAIPNVRSTNQSRTQSGNGNVLPYPLIPLIPKIADPQNNDEGKRVVPGVLPYSQAHKPVENNTNKWLLPRNRTNRMQHHSSVSMHTQPNTHVNTNIHPPPPKVKLLIASSSLTKGIDHERFNSCLPLADGTARIQKWPGGRARHIKHYIGPHLIEEKPTAVLVQAGGNDLAELNRTPGDIKTIANDIVEIGIRAKKLGINDIFIGGVPVRRRQYSHELLHKLNSSLRTLCEQHDFIYIDNSGITERHLFDGVHLNPDGTKILANNYLDAIRVHYGGWLTEETSHLR